MRKEISYAELRKASAEGGLPLSMGHFEIIEILLRNGAYEANDKYGNTMFDLNPMEGFEDKIRERLFSAEN